MSYYSKKRIVRALAETGFRVEQIDRIKFVSLYEAFYRMSAGGFLRSAPRRFVISLSPISRRLGFFRDLEIVEVKVADSERRSSAVA